MGFVGAIDRDDVTAEVFVSLHGHPPLPAPTTAAWADAVLAQHEATAVASTPKTVRDHIAVYATAWGDDSDRLHLEYAIVQKGCERLESYRRFTQSDGELLEIDLEILGVVPPELAAGWLHAFFDAPLGAPAPAQRRFAYGHRSNL